MAELPSIEDPMTMTARYRGNKSFYQATYMALECNDYEPQRKVRPRRQINSANWRTYIVICDPIPVDRGGFAPGAAFGVCEIEEMLRQRTVSIGMRLESEGRILEVTECRSPNGARVLKLVESEL